MSLPLFISCGGISIVFIYYAPGRKRFETMWLRSKLVEVYLIAPEDHNCGIVGRLTSSPEPGAL